MTERAGSARPTDLPRHGVLLACAAAMTLAIGLWGGCSVERDYKVLSFFFDGVPDPEARQRALETGVGKVDITTSPTYTVHKPYAAEQCSECHGGRSRLTKRDSSLCLKCHKDEPTRYERMHGPVAAIACLWCHEPHESAYSTLLRDKPNAVCGLCHEAGALDSARVPEHADASRECLSCHDGHGGTQRYFLRAGVAQAQGKEAPVPRP